MEARLDYLKQSPQTVQALLKLNNSIEAMGLEKSLMHLVKLRASQINGCAFCIEMHSRQARKDGESEARLYLISAWHDSYLYSPRERAALAWTEALTKLGDHTPDDALFDRVFAEFPGEQIVQLTVLITMINSWNRISIAFRAVHAEPREQAA